MLIQIGENSVTVTPYGSLGDVYQTIGSIGRGQRAATRSRAWVRFTMLTLTGAVIGTLMVLVFACSAARADWRSYTLRGNTADAAESDVDAIAVNEQDNASLIITCVGKNRLLAIAIHEPRADWRKGTGMEVLITSDAANYSQLPFHGNAIGQTVVAVGGKNTANADMNELITYADETAAIAFMGHAQKLLSITVGGFTRSFSASNFRNSVEPVLRQCGLAWSGDDVKEVTD